MPEPMDVVREVLAAPTDLARLQALVAGDATYVSLNFDDPELKTIMPWCGTGRGPEAIADTFARVGRFWSTDDFRIEEMFASGGSVAVFGRFTYTSVKLGRTVTSPFSILAKVADGKLTFMQFMEDTFATARSFRTRGAWHFASDPDAGEVTVGADHS